MLLQNTRQEQSFFWFSSSNNLSEGVTYHITHRPDVDRADSNCTGFQVVLHFDKNLLYLQSNLFSSAGRDPLHTRELFVDVLFQIC